MIESVGPNAARDERIIGLYRDVLKQNPKNTRATVELGLFYHEIGRSSDAASLLKPLGVRSLTEKVILSTIVREYFEKQRYSELETAMTYMLDGAPESSDLNYVSALALNELGEKDAAIDHFGKVQPDSRFYENALVNTALIYQEQEKLDMAIAHLETAVGPMADDPELLLLLGTLYEEKKAYENAEEVLKRGIESDPDNPKIFFRLGVVYDKWGQKDQCIASMKTVIRLDPTHANALNYLGYTYADLGRNLDEAEQLIKRALKEKPDDGYITDSLGWVYFKKGMFEEAFEMIRKAVDMVPDDPIILEHLGDAYRQLDNREKALEFYRRSLDHRKEDSAAVEQKILELNGAATQTP